MVDFELSEEQKAIRDTVRKFVKNEMMPVAGDYDESAEFPLEVMQKAFEIGVLNAEVPTEYGGGGLGCMDEVLIAEEISYGCVGMSSSMLCNSLALMPILIGGTEEQKKKFLPTICDQKEVKFNSFCLTEPGAGSDAAAVATTARLDGDEYVINGNKCFITNGAYASQYTVVASTDREKKHRGLSLFVVPSGPGISIGKKEDKMGMRASNTVEVIFEDVRVPKENLIGNEGDGFKITMMTLDRTRPLIAAYGVGVSRRAFDEVIEYSTEREQFGRPIAMHQEIQFRLADIAKDIEVGRAITWYAAWLVDQGKGREASKVCAIAKTFCCDMAMGITTDVVQIFGGYGYMKDYPVEKLMRDAKLLQIYEGTQEVQRMVIASEILRRG